MRNAFTFTHVLGLVIFLSATLSNAQSDVTLTDNAQNVVLSNGLLDVTLTKSSAHITSMRYKGIEMLNDGYYSMDGGANYRGPSNCRYSVKINTPELVDVAMKRIWKDEPQAFDIDIHYVMKKGVSGIYCYATLDHPANYPKTGCGEWRMVWKLSNETLENIYVDELRHWQMPSAADYLRAKTTGIKEIVQLTTGPWAGKYDCKYDYNASYYDLGCWGHASNKNKVGGWMVLGGYEYFNDGPMKQDLNAASGINHIHFGMNHYNGPGIGVGEGEVWSKIYGPFLLYCNSGATGDQMWADAKAQVNKEKSQWPYAWLTDNKDYPLSAQRSSVSGRFIVHDDLKPDLNPSGAWIGLANPRETRDGKNWQFDSMGYQYWAKVNHDGSFTIPHVRPGEYTLYSFVKGAVGEFSREQISVAEGKPVALGEVVWHVPHPGKSIAWEIGIPDRTAKEFAGGDDYFHGYTWDQIGKKWPNPLMYTVGKSNWKKDWNYVQTGAEFGNERAPHRFQIQFPLKTVPSSGVATLTLAIASAQRASINIFVNDENKPFASVAPKVQGGNALLREGIHAKYCVEYVQIPVNLLKTGDNTISLVLKRANMADTHVMYDYLSLELP